MSMGMQLKEKRDFRDRTKQAPKDECDINNILLRYKRSGLVSHLAKGVPTYMDVSEVGDYKGAMDHLRATEKFFAGLPAKIRERFDNDPVAFLDYASEVPEADLKVELGDIAKVVLEKQKPAPPEGEGAGEHS